MRYENDLRGRNIRLLRLELDTYKAPIRCHLVEASLDNLPPYEALSYVWGDSEITEPIVCNGQTFHATKNLVRALRRIRLGISPPETEAAGHDSESSSQGHPTDATLLSGSASEGMLQRYRPDLLWVDALCINQADISERNNQVKLMKEVYSQAERVIVWLGDTKINNRSMSAITAAIDFVVSRVTTGLPNDWLEEADYKFGKLTLIQFQDSMRDRGWPDIWRVLRAAFCSNWWARVWCIQEAYLSRKTTILHRNSEIGSAHMYIFSVWFASQLVQNGRLTHSDVALILEVYPNIISCIHRFNPRSISAMNSASLLSCSKRAQAKDPRDRVYGLVGIIRANRIEIDYNKSVAEVYIDSVLQAAGDGLRVLSSVFHSSELINVDHLPSWVPNWDVKPDEFSGPEEMFFPRDSTRITSRRQVSELDPVRAHAGILRLQGILCDNVTSCTEILESAEAKMLFTEATRDRLRDIFLGLWQEIAVNGPSSSVSLLSWAKTFTGGSVNEWSVSEPASDVEERFVSAFITFLSSILPETIDLGNEERTPCGKTIDYEDYLLAAIQCKRAFRTSNAWLGLGPMAMRTGDVVAVFHGGVSPYVLRPIKDRQDHYHLVGECYVDNLTDEGAYNMTGENGVEERIFNLV